MNRVVGQVYVIAVTAMTLVVLLYVYVKPPQSMRVTRDGVAHFSPPVINPDTGESVALGTLVRHFRGD